MPLLCIEQERIAQSIRAVLSQLLSLHSAKIGAKGDLDRLERIDTELEKVHARQASLLEKFQTHTEAHGCRAPKAVSAIVGH